jgi:acyl-coenzyme A thioesterase PaaI-like protein
VRREIEPGQADFEMEPDERHHHSMGTLHGGVSCDLAAAARGHAYAANLGDGKAEVTSWVLGRIHDVKFGIPQCSAAR